MAMLQIHCKDCGSENSMRGWIDKEDLRNTEYEYMMDTITEKELYQLEQEGKIKDQWDKFENNPVCPDCGSSNVITF